MLSYLLVGLALGSVYAIAAGSLVITYVASGVFNLAFAAMALTVARIFYTLNTEQGWPIPIAAVVSLLVFAPLFGAFLYLALFRFLRGRSMIIKLMATTGLSVALPPLVDLVFGHLTSTAASGLAPRPLRVFRPFGAVVNLDQVMTYLGLVLVLAIGVGLLRFTEIGLKVRAMVDSEALTGLSGTDPARVAAGVWAVSGVLAGLTGILIAPTAGLSLEGMTSMMAAAFAAVVAARLRSLPIAVGSALLMGVATSLVQKYMDPESSFTAAVVPSVPFAFMLVALLFYAVRGRAGDTAVGGSLDRAIAVQGGDPATSPVTGSRSGTIKGATTGPGRIGVVATVLLLAVVVVLPTALDDYWVGLIAGGVALSIALMSFTLVTGEGGMVWLCQITFAGLGAVLTAELATNRGWPTLLAALAAALIVLPLGVLIGALTIRLGNLYIALVTLTFGLLVQTLVLTQDPFYNYGSGVALLRPGFAEEGPAFVYLCLAVFLVLGLVVLNVRRSTAGLALSAVRWSENGARTIGISVLQSKILVSGLATFVAALGGGFMAMNYQSTLPDSFNPFAGLVWLAILVTIGARSIMSALLAGLLFTVMPGIFSTYFPADLAPVPTVLFGLGALALARNPEGVVAQNGAALSAFVARRQNRGASDVPGPPELPGEPVGAGTPVPSASAGEAS